MAASDPTPLTREELTPFLERLEAGEPFKPILEELLLGLDVKRAEHLSLILREGRGAWLPLLRSAGGEALLVGNSFSATTHVLAALGFVPHLFDTSPERMRFEAARCAALTGVRCQQTLSTQETVLPFATDRFEVVVQEAGVPAPTQGWGAPLPELRRVCRGELICTLDNRMGYKRSLQRRGRFVVPGAGQFARELLHSKDGLRTLRGYRKTLQFEDCGAPRTFSIYPHSADFTHVVGLSEGAPRLYIGPKERENKLKMIGYRLGLFPHFTPSFAIISTETKLQESCRPRIERVLDDLAEISGERRGELDEWIATRGNCVVALTRSASEDESDTQGRFALHIALSPHKQQQVQLHDKVIRDLWDKGQPVPVPEPIFFGSLQGLTLSCERRLGGLSAPQLSGDPRPMGHLLKDAVRHLAALATGARQTIDEVTFAEHFDWRFELVTRHAGREDTRRALLHMRDEARERLSGETLPLVLQHADLRNKHVQVDPHGHVLGYLDWGSSRANDVPYFDLLQLVVHERKQTRGGSIRHAWRALLTEGGLPDWERAALSAYARKLGLSPNFCQAMEAIFPVFVAAMAESNWDYSRPRWVHRSFGI